MKRLTHLLLALLAAAAIGFGPQAWAQDDEAAPTEEAADGTDEGTAEDGDEAAADGEDADGSEAADTGDADDDDAAGVELEEEESPFSMGLIISYIALFLGGGAAVLGIWVDRDQSRPTIFAVAMSALITSAVVVGAVQGFLDSQANIEKRRDLQRMLGMVNEIAMASGDPELIALAKAETGIDIEATPPEDEADPADELAEDPEAAEGGADGEPADDTTPEGDAEAGDAEPAN